MIIGIDHGFHFMKTAHSCFVSGVAQMNYEPPLLARTVHYQDAWYVVGGTRLAFCPNKTEDDHYYILTMAALAEEMRARGVKNATVQIAAGLPFKRLGTEKQGFVEYLKKKKELTWEYEGEGYHAKIVDAMVFPQGYAAIFSRLQELPGLFILADLGGGTMDVSLVENMIPNIAKTKSLNIGCIQAIEEIQEELQTRFGQSVEEEQIRALIFGKPSGLPKRYEEVIRQGLEKYAGNILGKITELGFNRETLPVVWCGGGAALMKNYGKLEEERNQFLPDTAANAKGYEKMYAAVQTRKER